MEAALIVVTEENINKYTIDDVLMPLVGYRTKLPPNAELQKIINDIMEEDQMSFNNFDQQASMDNFTSAWGSYRKIVARAENIVYDIVKF